MKMTVETRFSFIIVITLLCSIIIMIIRYSFMIFIFVSKQVSTPIELRELHYIDR